MSNVLDRIATAEHLGPSEPLVPMPADLAEYEDAENPEVRGGGWQIKTAQSADWALLRLSECRAEAEEIRRQAVAAIARIEARRDALLAKVARGESYFTFKITEYAVTHRSEIVKGKKKSRDFIHGRIGFRKRGDKLTVTDAAALRDWLATQPVESGLYRMKIEPEMSALQARFRESGEIPPGMDYEVETESISIDATAPESALAKGE